MAGETGRAMEAFIGAIAAMKSPQRYGGFKNVFTNRPVLVYGTKGTPEENAWALAKARYDSETFWYRGNATFEVIPTSSSNRNATATGTWCLRECRDQRRMATAAWRQPGAGSPRRGACRG
jgi:hypothetical protein